MNADYARDVWFAAKDHLDELGKRVLMGALVSANKKRGWFTEVARATGAHKSYLAAGVHEIATPAGSPGAAGADAGHARAVDVHGIATPAGSPGGTAPGGGGAPAARRQRRPGGGRKSLLEKDATLRDDIEGLMSPHTRGDPAGPLRWTGRSLRATVSALSGMGHAVSHNALRGILLRLGYTLQSNRKALEGGDHADRDAQFEKINEISKLFMSEGCPVVSVDAKKKELVGNFKNAGREWGGKGRPEMAGVYDFIGEGGRATPCGVYGVADNEGFVSVGISHDTAEFAVRSIETWWERMGKQRYPAAKAVFITADGGGGNGSRNRLWKVRLQEFCDRHGVSAYVSHFPPGTSKWNKIEHRLFSMISLNWRGKPLTTLQVIVSLIAATTTESGLKVRCAADLSEYRTGVPVSDEEMRGLNIKRNAFHPEWNYAIFPSN
jgi:hypothetical protein